MIAIDVKIKDVINKYDDGTVLISVSNNVGDSLKAFGVFGSFIDKLVGYKCKLIGNFTSHEIYGDGFNFLSLEVSPLYFYVGEHLKTGIRKDTIDKIFEDKSDNEVIEIFSDKDKLSKYIKSKNAINKFLSKWKDEREKINFIKLKFLTKGITLSQYELIVSYCEKIKINLQDFYNSFINDPYILTNVPNIGFKKADEIARNLGITFDDKRRIKAYLRYIFKEISEKSGDTAITIDALIFEIKQNLSLNNLDKIINQVLDEIIKEGKLVKLISNINSDIFVTPTKYYEKEIFIYNFLKSKVGKEVIPEWSSDRDFLMYINYLEKKHNITYNYEQRQAIYYAYLGLNSFCVIGLAGSGKTTVIKAIIETYQYKFALSDDTICCCSVSGIASDRLRKATGYEARTIRSLVLRLSDIKSKSEASYRLIVIDEASMADLDDFYDILSNIDESCIVIFVGDNAQLPPIGKGNVFNDIIKYRLIPIVQLNTIFRQDNNSVIRHFAKNVRDKIIPLGLYSKGYSDFYIYTYPNKKPSKFQQNYEELKVKYNENKNKWMSDKVIELYFNIFDTQNFEMKLKEKKFISYLYDLQIITPIIERSCGTTEFNRIISKRLAEKRKTKYKEKGFNLYDKVMHTENCTMKCLPYDVYENLKSYNTSDETLQRDIKLKSTLERKIYNGQIGIILHTYNDDSVDVLYPFDNIVVHYKNKKEIDKLMLAYAVTIHKIQGSEASTVIMPLGFQHYIMLNNALLYTAITRASEKLFIVGEYGAFEYATRNIYIFERFTNLKLICEYDYKPLEVSK